MKRLAVVAAFAAVVLSGCASTNGGNGMSGKKKFTAKYDYSVKELDVQNGENRIYGKVYVPQGDEGEKFPVIIASHGYNGRHSDFEGDLRAFAEKGFIGYGYDFCGGSVFSKSSMRTDEMTVFTEKSDLISVFNYFSEREDVDSDHIYLLGGSQGGLVTALAAEELGEKVRGIALYFPALCIADDWRSTFPTVESIENASYPYNFWGMNLGKNFFTSIHDLDVLDSIGNYPRNVLIVHGDNDVIVNYSYSQKAQAKYGKTRCVLYILPGEGHGFSPQGTVFARNCVEKFISSNW